MAAPKRQRVHAARAAGNTRAKMPLTPTQQKTIQHFGHIGKSRAVAEIKVKASLGGDGVCKGRKRKMEDDFDAAENVKVEDDADDENQAVQMGCEMSRKRKRMVKEACFKVEEKQEQLLPTPRPALVKEENKLTSKLASPRPMHRKRKRVSFVDVDDDVDDVKDEEDVDMENTSATLTSTQSSHLPTPKTNVKTSEAIYRASISDEPPSSESHRKRPCSNPLISSTRLRAGQKRLEDIKADAIKSKADKDVKAERAMPKAFALFDKRQQQQQQQQQNHQPTQPEATTTSTANSPSARTQCLLDRILEKQAWLAALPRAPSKAEQERRAALYRAEEIIGILALLASRSTYAATISSSLALRNANPNPRTSFSLKALVQSIQGSVRSPLASEEVERVLEVLESEEEEGIAPVGFVRLVRTGGVSAVVVCPRLKPSVTEVRERVAEALKVERY